MKEAYSEAGYQVLSTDVGNEYWILNAGPGEVVVKIQDAQECAGTRSVPRPLRMAPRREGRRKTCTKNNGSGLTYEIVPFESVNIG